MGFVLVETELRALTGTQAGFRGEFLVDTGSIDCMAPGDQLLAAGIVPRGTRSYEVANDGKVEFEYGFAIVQFAGAETVTQVIFGPAGVEPILGVVALENAGMTVDPTSNSLNRLQSKRLKGTFGVGV